VAEDNCFGDASFVCDLPGGYTIEAVTRKKRGGNLEYLLLAI
jgi:hypothetical protein